MRPQLTQAVVQKGYRLLRHNLRQKGLVLLAFGDAALLSPVTRWACSDGERDGDVRLSPSGEALSCGVLGPVPVCSTDVGPALTQAIPARDAERGRLVAVTLGAADGDLVLDGLSLERYRHLSLPLPA